LRLALIDLITFRLAAVMAPVVDVGVLPLNAEKNYGDTAMVVVVSAELWIGPCTL